MANPAENPDPSPFSPDDEIDEVLGGANPNPQRVGCPPRDVLSALAHRRRPIGDPAYEHLAKCSPCYREFRALQQGAAAISAGGARRRRWWAAAAAAAVLLTAGTWFVLSRAGGRTSAPAEVSAQIDLRKYPVERSQEPQAEPEALTLTRGRLNVTILLPVGSEPGEYEIRVLDSDLRQRASAVGTAAIRNYVTTLQTPIDLTGLPPGAYRLAVRRQGEEWRLFPVRLNEQ
jgi:hypothetical protein